MRRVVISILMLVAVKAPVMAKDKPFQVVSWPESGQPVLRFTFSKFNGVGPSIGKEHTYVSDVAAENLSDKTITGASFSLYLFDKTNARIGEGSINLTDVSAGQIVKFQVTIEASGYPSSVTVASSAPRTISITVNSVPQGAALAVDGKAMGITPKIVDVAIGKHILLFEKEGFNSGRFPLEISARDTSGGSVSYELGSAAHDTIELRDGSVIAGDLLSISGMQVEVRVGGGTQTFNRNQVKRILLTEREPQSN